MGSASVELLRTFGRLALPTDVATSLAAHGHHAVWPTAVRRILLIGACKRGATEWAVRPDGTLHSGCYERM
jgi:hypothetical protein